MNLKKLFEMQKVLDERIVAEHNIKHERFNNLVMALLDEIGECAKETRCFKDWSKKEPSPREVILEEYVDGFHFVLSLSLLIGYDKDVRPFIENYPIWKKQYRHKADNLVDQFLIVYEFAISMKHDNHWINLFTSYMVLGEMLGFTWEDIERAYIQKNTVNHERQNNGY